MQWAKFKCLLENADSMQRMLKTILARKVLIIYVNKRTLIYRNFSKD